jgi:hypothetical protein
MLAMEQVLSGEFQKDSDPICRAVDLKHAGENAEAREVLMDLCQADPPCVRIDVASNEDSQLGVLR